MSDHFACPKFNITITYMYYRGGLVQWVVRLTRNMNGVGSSPSMAPVVSFSKKIYHYCLVLVGSMNGFERDFIIELK